jgi:hypothetical protein
MTSKVATFHCVNIFAKPILNEDLPHTRPYRARVHIEKSCPMNEGVSSISSVKTMYTGVCCMSGIEISDQGRAIET